MHTHRATHYACTRTILSSCHPASVLPGASMKIPQSIRRASVELPSSIHRASIEHLLSFHRASVELSSSSCVQIASIKPPSSVLPSHQSCMIHITSRRNTGRKGNMPSELNMHYTFSHLTRNTQMCVLLHQINILLLYNKTKITPVILIP